MFYIWTTISPSSRSYIRHGRCMMCAMRLLCMQCPIQLSTRIQVNLEFVTRKSQHKITFYEPAFADQKHEGQQRIFEQPGPHHLHSRARASESNSISHQRHCFTVKSSYRCCTGRDHSCDFHWDCSLQEPLHTRISLNQLCHTLRYKNELVCWSQKVLEWKQGMGSTAHQVKLQAMGFWDYAYATREKIPVATDGIPLNNRLSVLKL
jgi:hypothetical protein